MPTLNIPQARFIAMPHKFKAFVAGFGSGKTWVGCAGLCKHFWEYPKVNAGYFAPTYGQIKDIFHPTIEEVAFDWGMRTALRLGDKECDIYAGRQYRGTIKCRSMEDPNKIVGFKIGHALVDELDILKKEKAERAWLKIIARMRYKLDGIKNGIDVTTTPEGFKFVYQRFVKSLREKPELSNFYGLVQASTYDNQANLPDDYITSLFESYPQQLIDAYLKGKFCNLNTGSVYAGFDRKLNHTDQDIGDYEALHIGMDFNVMNMSATINVIRNGLPYTLAEITGVKDTPAMAKLIEERYEGHTTTIYPDATGKARKSVGASQSDLSILRQAGFSVIVDNANPSVKDRVNAMNGMILNGKGERRYKVNTNNCPKLTESLEQQSYDSNSEPDKDSGHDHLNDAQGYFIAKKYPIKSRAVRTIKVKGT